jgi:hypothetical protein
MTTRIDSDAANLVADVIADEFDSVAGTMSIYQGDGDGVPADADTAITDQTLLAQITLPTPAFGAAAAGACAKAGTWQDASANATGSADGGFFRIVSNGGHVIQGEIGAAKELTLDDYSIVAGGVVTVSSYSFTVPESA